MARLPYRTIAVSGASMSPTYNDGDWLLFRTIKESKRSKGFGAKKLQSLIGKVVVIERESYPGVLFIKRILRIDESGLWVEGDNKETSTDSRQWGALSLDEIRGIVLFRYRTRSR